MSSGAGPLRLARLEQSEDRPSDPVLEAAQGFGPALGAGSLAGDIRLGQLVSRVFGAPRALVYRAFTDPDQLAAWWGPIGNSLPRDHIEFDVRPGGYQRWIEVSASEPDLRVHINVDLTDVADGELLEGFMHVTGQLQEGIEPFETKFRFEFHDEVDGRTRLEIRQWLPEHLTGPSEGGWLEAFAKLDAMLNGAPAGSAPVVEV